MPAMLSCRPFRFSLLAYFPVPPIEKVPCILAAFFEGTQGLNPYRTNFRAQYSLSIFYFRYYRPLQPLPPGERGYTLAASFQTI